MTPVDWALGMVSILMSLALGDITLSLHRMMRHRHQVQWDARVVIAAGLVVQTIIRMWFLVWNVRNVRAVLAFPFYFSMFVDFMLLFLLAAACLPDDAEEETSLSTFYDEHRRYFWTLFALFHLIYFGHFIYFAHGAPGALPRIVEEGVPLLLFVVLIRWRARWLHILLPLAMLIFYFALFWRATLSERMT